MWAEFLLPDKPMTSSLKQNVIYLNFKFNSFSSLGRLKLKDSITLGFFICIKTTSLCVTINCNHITDLLKQVTCHLICHFSLMTYYIHLYSLNWKQQHENKKTNWFLKIFFLFCSLNVIYHQLKKPICREK